MLPVFAIFGPGNDSLPELVLPIGMIRAGYQFNVEPVVAARCADQAIENFLSVSHLPHFAFKCGETFLIHYQQFLSVRTSPTRIHLALAFAL